MICFGLQKKQCQMFNGVIPGNDGALKKFENTLRCFEENAMNLIPGYSRWASDFVWQLPTALNGWLDH